MQVKELMTREVVSIPGHLTVREMVDEYFGIKQQFRSYPVVDEDNTLLGLVGRDQARAWLEDDPEGSKRVAALMDEDPVVAYPDESCRSAAIRAAVEKLDHMPVVTTDHKLVGMLARYDLLETHAHEYGEEVLRERVFGRRREEPGKPR